MAASNWGSIPSISLGLIVVRPGTRACEVLVASFAPLPLPLVKGSLVAAGLVALVAVVFVALVLEAVVLLLAGVVLVVFLASASALRFATWSLIDGLGIEYFL